MTNISNADYHADPAISASQLKEISRSPFHYWSRYLDPNRVAMVPTAAMRFGSLAHCAVLEPDELSKRYQLAPDRRTKEGKAAVIEMAAAGIEAVSEADLAQALQIADAVRSNSTAALLLSDGAAEQSFWWDDVSTGLRCKCRPDWLSADGATIVDLKTCVDASPAGFAKSVAQWSYQVQSAHYLCGTLAKRFIFVAVEKSFPYAIGVYELDAQAMVHGAVLRHNALQIIQDCRAINFYPGYTDGIQTLQLPGWALKDNTSITSEDF
jgi:exodeoxyribonuclease VIII